MLGADDTVDFQPINRRSRLSTASQRLVNDLSAAKFDIRVDIGPRYTTQRIEAATSMMDYAKSDPTALPVFRDLLVANMDWPGAQQMAERLKKSIPPQYLDADEQQGQPQQQQAPDPASAVCSSRGCKSSSGPASRSYSLSSRRPFKRCRSSRPSLIWSAKS